MRKQLRRKTPINIIVQIMSPDITLTTRSPCLRYVCTQVGSGIVVSWIFPRTIHDHWRHLIQVGRQQWRRICR